MEFHSSYSPKPVGKKALWFSECDRRSCSAKEGFSETCLILLSKVSEQFQTGRWSPRQNSVTTEKQAHTTPAWQRAAFYVLYVKIWYHQSFQLLSHLSTMEQSQTPVADNSGGDWTTTALKRAAPLQDTQITDSFHQKIAWARQQSGNKAATQLPVPLPSHKAHPPVCLHQQMLPRHCTAAQFSRHLLKQGKKSSKDAQNLLSKDQFPDKAV